MDTYVVPADDEGARLDRWLAGQLPGYSRSQLQRWIRAGDVTVDGEAVRPSHTMLPGQIVAVAPPPVPQEPVALPQPIPLAIVYEDSDVVVVDKPSGMVVHPAPGHPQDTLVNAILHHCPDLEGIGGVLRPGIVHRLDKETSGLIVIAKNEAALRNLQAQFKARTVHKLYIALLEGFIEPESGRINVAVGRHPTDRKRQATFPSGSGKTSGRVREAVTEYKTVAHYSAQSTTTGDPGRFSLVHASPQTGRTHQLRVHFAWMKHPIVGDTIYGYRKQRIAVGRLFLHAFELSLDLPSSGERIEFTAPLPSTLTDELDSLASG